MNELFGKLDGEVRFLGIFMRAEKGSDAIDLGETAFEIKFGKAERYAIMLPGQFGSVQIRYSRVNGPKRMTNSGSR